MFDNFHSVTLRQAIALQIFYTSPEDDNLHGRVIAHNSWVDVSDIIESVVFRRTGEAKDDNLEKLIAAKSYKEILKQYDKPGATFEMVVLYKHGKTKLKEMNLSKGLESIFSPEELPNEIIKFLLEKPEYSFLR